MRSTTTVKRLARKTLDNVETNEWLPARREAMASILKGLHDPTLKIDIEKRMDSWLPARLSYRSSLIEAFAEWQPTEQLQDLLLRAMYDEDRSVQRAAAHTYAKIFANSNEARQQLHNRLAYTRDLSAATALLESLAIAWPNSPEAKQLFDDAWESDSAELRLVGILGLASIGLITDEARDEALRCQSFWSDVSFSSRDLATSILIKHWPGDEKLTKSALDRLSPFGGSHSPWEYDSAYAYLINSPLDRADVRSWIITELGQKHPFNAIHAQQVWSYIGRIASSDSEIRNLANSYWCDPSRRLVNMHSLPNYTAHVADPIVAEALIETLLNKSNHFDRYWALRALLTGWGRNHLLIKQPIDSLADAKDEDLDDLVALLPEIIQNKTQARERLICMGKRTEVRRDLLARAFTACDCDATDDEAVTAILAYPEQSRGIFDVSKPLFGSFAQHPKVRAFAQSQVSLMNGPLAAIASCYPNDSDFEAALFDAAAPLPVDLRTQIVEFASTGVAGTNFEKVMRHALQEVDPELRARMAISHYSRLPPQERDAAIQELLDNMTAVGHDFHSLRATALVGLVAVGALDTLKSKKDGEKLVALETKNFIDGIPSVERLICEKFAEFESIFGDGLPERFTSFTNKNRLPEILSTAPNASPASRAAFLLLAEQKQIPHTAQALRALAAEHPNRDLLLSLCWNILDNKDYTNLRATTNADVGLILREHFPNDENIRLQLINRLKETPDAATAITLAIYAPDTQELTLPTDFDKLDNEFADWTVAVHIAACRADSVVFCKLLEAMLVRSRHTQFDAQQFTNMAINERLQRDEDLEGLMSAKIDNTINPSISGSFARYLAAAGKLGAETRSKCLDLLQALAINQRLPVAGYDAIADQWRAVRVVILDAISAELELS